MWTLVSSGVRTAWTRILKLMDSSFWVHVLFFEWDSFLLVLVALALFQSLSDTGSFVNRWSMVVCHFGRKNRRAASCRFSVATLARNCRARGKKRKPPVS